MSVEIVNTTTVPVKISKGSGGVYRLTGLIDPSKKFVLRMHKSSTYREFLLTTKPESLPVGSSLTFDDVVDHSKIEIKETEIPGDGPVWIGIPNVKCRGVMVLVSRWFRDQSVVIPIVNRLRNQHVKIEENEGGRVHTIEDVAPDVTYLLSVDPNDTHRSYHLTTLPDNRELGRVSSDELKSYSRIEITTTRKVYHWQGVSPGRREWFRSL